MALKKDQNAVYSVQMGEKQKWLLFRWTLLTNEGLVVLANYDGFPRQYVLERKYRQESFSIPLTDSGYGGMNVPSLLISWNDFDTAAKRATFGVLLSDDKSSVIIERQKPKNGDR